MAVVCHSGKSLSGSSEIDYAVGVTNSDPPATVPIVRRFAQVSPRLRPYVDRIWSWESDAAVSLPLLFPGTGAELVFHYGAPFATREKNGGERLLSTRALVMCLRSCACQLVATGPVSFMAVRLRGEALRHFARAPLFEWIDGLAPIEAGMGGGWHDLPERLAEAPGFSARVAILEAHLEQHLALREMRPSIIDRAVARLYYNADSVRVADVSDGLGLSARHFERLFQDATGLTPKRFHRVARFHHVMRRLLLERRSGYLETALASGFYDQAHFIHECRDFTGRSPGELLTRENFLSHFYNPRLTG
jgi:AraC-like DNA-binding protein